MTTKKLKEEIRKTLKMTQNYLDEANKEIEETGDTEYDIVFLEYTINFYKDMMQEIEYREINYKKSKKLR